MSECKKHDWYIGSTYSGLKIKQCIKCELVRCV